MILIVMVSSYHQQGLAAGYQSHQSIYAKVKEYVSKQIDQNPGNEVSVDIGQLDKRLKMKRCSRELQAFMPKGSRQLGNTTVGVKCTGKTPWSMHVPVTINRFKAVLVANHQLQKGHMLEAGDAGLKRKNIALLPYGYLDSHDKLKGLKLKRRVRAGTVLTPSMLKKPQIVSRGQQLSIIAHSGRMMVRVDGKALANGAIGDRIKVMNLKSKQKLEGIVTASGDVRVDI